MSQPPGPRIYLVAAVASNGIIGANGRLPWHFPEELKHFKEVTLGHPVIMGRRTWESLEGPAAGPQEHRGDAHAGLPGAGRRGGRFAARRRWRYARTRRRRW